MEKAKIIFATDAQIASNDSLQKFVENSPGSYTVTVSQDELLVIIKEVKSKDQTYEKVRSLAGDISRDLGKRKINEAIIDEKTLTEALQSLERGAIATAFVEGWHLGAYQFITYKSKDESFITQLTFINDENIKEAIALGEIRAESVSLSRNFMNEVPSTLNPETFPKILTDTFKDTNVDVKVLNEDDLKEMKMNGLLAVCRGSKHSPSFVELSYQGNPDKPLVALVGKGVTFDTGGISLKPARNMANMKMDMGGAAAVAGAMHLLAKSEADVNVVALIPIVENMPDAHALLPGEIIHYKNDCTVHVGNTDAEGRLILADALIRAGELEAEYIIDIATLTGAIANALGSKLAGIFGDDELLSEMKKIGDENGDYTWPMPLVDAYDRYLDSTHADFSHISSRSEAGAITAALFLRRFVPESAKWVHVDMAGVMRSEESGYYTKEATGFGVRLLADFTEHLAKTSS